jgi:hypothetical protein
VTRTLPLDSRNRLAELILAALHEASARRELGGLADASAAAPPPGWLAHDQGEHVPALLERARRAAGALAGRPLLAPDPDVHEALDAAAALFDAGLYFEVHELLEPHWARATGAERDGLQGAIQVAVGYQHLANDNAAGARSLLAEGIFRLERAGLPRLDVTAFVHALRASLATLTTNSPLAPPPFPRPQASSPGQP